LKNSQLQDFTPVSSYPYPPQPQQYPLRQLRIVSEPVYPTYFTQDHTYTPTATYPAPGTPQRHRTLSAGAEPYFINPTISAEALPPTLENNDEVDLQSQSQYQDISWTDSASGDLGIEYLEGSGWPAEIPIPDQYLAQPAHEESPIDDAPLQETSWNQHAPAAFEYPLQQVVHHPPNQYIQPAPEAQVEYSPHEHFAPAPIALHPQRQTFDPQVSIC
jgi:hypothetical protein